MLSVKADIKQATKQLNAIEKSVIPKATVMALNKTLTGARTDAKRTISKSAGVKQKEIKNDFVLMKATSSKRVAVLIGRGRPLALSKFSVRQTKKGVSARLPGRKRTMIEGAFIATMPSGHRGVYMRAGKRRGARRTVKSGRNTGKRYRPQLPIKEFFVTSVPVEMRKDPIMRVIRKAALGRFRTELPRAINRKLARYK